MIRCLSLSARSISSLEKGSSITGRGTAIICCIYK
jgi:hypothetical protein